MYAAAATERVRMTTGRKGKKYPIYVYPLRNPLYAEFVQKYQQHIGASKVIKQSALRKLIYDVWEDTRREFDAWRTERETNPLISLIIPNLTGSTKRTDHPYNLYLDYRDEAQAPIMDYIASLEPSDRQLFWNLILVRGMQNPYAEQIIKGI